MQKIAQTKNNSPITNMNPNPACAKVSQHDFLWDTTCTEGVQVVLPSTRKTLSGMFYYYSHLGGGNGVTLPFSSITVMVVFVLLTL